MWTTGAGADDEKMPKQARSWLHLYGMLRETLACSLLRAALCYLLFGPPQELGKPALRKQSGEVGTVYSMMLQASL